MLMLVFTQVQEPQEDERLRNGVILTATKGKAVGAAQDPAVRLEDVSLSPRGWSGSEGRVRVAACQCDSM